MLQLLDLRNDKQGRGNGSFVFLLKHKIIAMWEKAMVIWVLLFIPFPLCLQVVPLPWIGRGAGKYNSSENAFLHLMKKYLKLFKVKVHWKILWEKKMHDKI